MAVIKSIDLSKLTKDQIKDANLEGEILKELEHPNIIHFREVQNHNNYLFIVMDYADGGDLSMKIKEQNGKFFPEDKILDWFTQVCLAIKHIHDRRILHRDIKSQNIFLMKNGQVKLGDFGIAKCLDHTIDKAKTYVGTPYYLSPEIINSQPYDFKSDIWSLGVLLYEMCALKMPFDASNLPQLYIKIINCNYPPLNNIYSEPLKKLVKSMLNETSIKRPNITEILNEPIIKSRIKKFLNEKEYQDEFSHTILHNFSLSTNNTNADEKMTKNELVNNNTNNNINNNNYMNNNIRASQGHRPIIKKDLYDRNMRASGNDVKNSNYHYQQQQQREINRINLLKKNLEVKTNFSNKQSNRQGSGKYNGNNAYNYFGNNFGNNNYNNNNNNNNAKGLYIINEAKEYKKNDVGRNKKGKNTGREEFSSDKIGKNKNNIINNSENIYNGLKSENSTKYSNKKRFEYDRKNNNNIINNNNNNLSNNNSHRDKEKERKQKLEEAKRKLRRESKNTNLNSDGVIWMRGMENYVEKRDESVNDPNANKDNTVLKTNDNLPTKETDRLQYEDLINNSNKKEINGKNLLPLNNNFININLNNYSYEEMNEEEINSNNKLYEDLLMKKETLNYIDNNTNNGMKINNNSQDIFANLKEDLNYENNLEINENKVIEDVWDDIANDFGKELTQNISNIIKKYVKDDMLSYDYSKITENIVKDLKYKNIEENIIEKAINKIPDIYFLVLCNKL